MGGNCVYQDITWEGDGHQLSASSWRAEIRDDYTLNLKYIIIRFLDDVVFVFETK